MSDLLEPDVLASLLRQWSRSLRARNRSPRTIETYTDSAQELAGFARRHGHAELDLALIEDYLADQAERWKPATVAFRYRSLQQFTKWLTAEDELPADPMAGMQAPKVPEEPVPVLTRDQLKALLAVCKGSGFTERRDTAIIRLFLDTGMRLSELAGIAVNDLDLNDDLALVAAATSRSARPATSPSSTGSSSSSSSACWPRSPATRCCTTSSPRCGWATAVRCRRRGSARCSPAAAATRA